MGKWSDMAKALEGDIPVSPSVPIVPLAPIGSIFQDSAPKPPPNGTIGANGSKGEQQGPFPQWWRSQVAGIAAGAPAGVPVWWWQAIREASVQFLESWGDAAASLGWSTADLFSVHARRPYERVDAYGLCVLLAGRPVRHVVALTATGATIRADPHITSFHQPPQETPGTVLIWELTDRC